MIHYNICEQFQCFPLSQNQAGKLTCIRPPSKPLLLRPCVLCMTHGQTQLTYVMKYISTIYMYSKYSFMKCFKINNLYVLKVAADKELYLSVFINKL